ncbi:riboflavin synthase domain-like protein [Colletotrichum caudatum]|nr:riboflavin synthase domain-like protein [Colletotrichum caudatum]
MTTLLEHTTYTDYGLQLAIALGTTFVYNNGNYFQRQTPTSTFFLEALEAISSFAILWGLQSGTAENLAHCLGREIHQHFKSKVVVIDLSDYNPSLLSNVPEHVILVLVMSTYGEGDPSVNAQDFVSFYTSKNSCTLSHLQFAAFGCGNSSYQRYNKAIHDTASSLQRCGAKAILPTGEGDETSRTTHEDFHEWRDSFFSCLVSQCNLSKHDAGYKPTVLITLQSPSDEVARDESESKPKKGAAYLPITMSRQLARYDEPTRSCVFIALDLAGHPQLKYRTGDQLAIWPCNPNDEVDRLLRVLGRKSQRNDCLRIESIDELGDLSVPASTTLCELVSKHLDICAQVPRETVLALAQMASNLEGNYLTLSRLMDYTLALHPAAAWDSLPLSFIINHIPHIQPRLYSIASSSIVEPRQVSLVVSVKPQPVPRCPDTLIHGLSCTDGYFIQAEIRRSSFKMPFNLQIPIIMIAAGTGIALFQAFIYERARLASIGREVGPMLLFFGCQSQPDCLFLDEFSSLASRHASQPELRIHTAFSRPVASDSEPRKQKAYVQDKLSEHRQSVIKTLLEENASLYVLLETVISVQQWSRSEAEQWRQERKKSSRWHEDVWS